MYSLQLQLGLDCVDVERNGHSILSQQLYLEHWIRGEVYNAFPPAKTIALENVGTWVVMNGSSKTKVTVVLRGILSTQDKNTKMQITVSASELLNNKITADNDLFIVTTKSNSLFCKEKAQVNNDFTSGSIL
ncbi:hypothetical protein ON010_g292 [Phytophthora cinnamomi]|nr:hypothetical protein ON010_g292 [Phytophthora cinnamomi]